MLEALARLVSRVLHRLAPVLLLLSALPDIAQAEDQVRLGWVFLGGVQVRLLAFDHAEHQVARLDVVLIGTLR